MGKRRKRWVLDKNGEKYPFSRGVLAKSLVNLGLSVDEAYGIAEEVASNFKGTISSRELVRLVYRLLVSKFSMKVARKYKQLVKNEILVIENNGRTSTPFSRGILANSIKSAGISTSEAFTIAQKIADKLRHRGLFRVKRSKLRRIASDILKKEKGEEFSLRYLLWRRAKILEKPIIVLIGGATGVGKSKLAAELTTTIDISRIASTDSIREVMRSMLSKDIVPSIHVSSYEAGRVLYKFIELDEEKKVIYGYLDQSEKILTGVEAVINRAIKENVSIIVEGIQLVPGAFEKFSSKAYIIQVLLVTLDEDIHRSRFILREKKSQRTSKKYLKNFKAIRLIQDYLYKRGKDANIPIIDNIDFDRAKQEVLKAITDRLLKEVNLS